MNITRPVVMEVNLNNFEHNMAAIREKIGKDVAIMPVIKASGYGTYINRRLDVLNEFDIVAVANVDEAVFVRELGYEKQIFVLNQPYETEIDKIVAYDIVVGISSYHFAELLGKKDSQIKVHLEIGTGMGRTGVHPYKIDRYIAALPKNVVVEGIYTHLSSADIDDEYTKKQLKNFRAAVETAKNLLGEIKYVHAAASNGIVNYPDSHFNLVRTGIIMYGYAAADDTLDKININPITSLKAKITFLKTVQAGTSIGYSRSYITDKEAIVATVPIGYADGFRRTFSNGWEVMVKGQRVPIIGKVCMDSFMIDVTDIEGVEVGDEVIIWDENNIPLEDLAAKCDTINYEILCTISDRVPRLFVK